VEPNSKPIYQAIYLGVIGKPIIQSLSPIIHETAFEQLGLNGAYLRLAVDSIQEALACAQEMGLGGINVTAPFKEDVLSEVKISDRDVIQVAAANTIVIGDTTSAYNTDLYGILESLGLSQKRADGKTALLIGAGGAAKAAAHALKQIGCRVFICNRTAEKADQAAAALGINAINFEDAALLLKNTDYLINTVFTTEEILKLEHLQNHTLVLDAIYAKQTPFSKSCQNNPNYIDGKTWLLHQGIKALEIFTGQKLNSSQQTVIRNRLFSETKSKPQTISLIGMMGSGKTSVSVSLGSIFGKEAVDLDEVIEKRAGCTIAKLVTDKGEEVFRKLESECLAEVLVTAPKILSCGGGIVGSQHNRELLAELTTPIWLWASVEELTKRLSKFSNRPLFFGHDLPTRIDELLEQRFSHYAKLSELVVPTVGKTTTEIAKRIAFETFSYFPTTDDAAKLTPIGA